MMPLPASYSQRERLAYLELRAYFIGELRRVDLETRFQIKPAAATRDLNAYRALAPENLRYDTHAKTYMPTESFRPILGFSADRVLSWLLRGFGDGQTTSSNGTIPCDGPAALVTLSFERLATITRAVHRKQLLEIQYTSVTSGKSTRVIAPVALADNGARWHVRAFDRMRNRFADFVLTRIICARMLREHAAEHEGIDADAQWNREIELDLVPHPSLTHPEAITSDYAMTDGHLRLISRAALAGYALVRWSVDCSKRHTLDPSLHHLWLANRQVLQGIESAKLAPGYQES